MGFQSQLSGNVHLSVVAPAHNEADNLPRLLEEIAAALAPLEKRLGGHHYGRCQH